MTRVSLSANRRLRMQFQASGIASPPPLISLVGFGTPDGSATYTPGLPSGWAQNDLLIVAVVSREGSSSTHTVDGFTQRGSTVFVDDGATGSHLSIWTKLAGASESAPNV